MVGPWVTAEVNAVVSGTNQCNKGKVSALQPLFGCSRYLFMRWAPEDVLCELKAGTQCGLHISYGVSADVHASSFFVRNKQTIPVTIAAQVLL